jgi:hypothetical protein
MRLTQLRRSAVLALATGAMFASSACFGSFNLTRKVYEFNKSVSDDKFVRELVFLGLGVVQVYSIGAFIDAVIVNSIEFWTGENPVKVATIRVDSATTVARVIFEKDGHRVMTLKTFQFDQLVALTTVEQVPGADDVSFRTRMSDGSTVTRVVGMGQDGSPRLVSQKTDR